MDEVGGENLWVGTNGHSSSAQGGTGAAAVNIFGDGVGGRPANPTFATKDNTSNVFTMALQNPARADGDRSYGYRGREGSTAYGPPVASQAYSFLEYSWGATPAGSTAQTGYHSFTCSKCHNPHASRLPKLLITNCLDTSKNTWQSGTNSGNNTQSNWDGDPADWGEKAATWNTAQNCHRLDPNEPVGSGGGWNKVTPW